MKSRNTDSDYDVQRNANSRLDEGRTMVKIPVEIERRLQKLQQEKPPLKLPNTICLSRQIGTGASDIAQILGQNLGYFVADREIVTQIARNGYLSQRTVKLFDERYPGKLNELMSKFFSVRSFDFKDYMQHLIATIYTLAETGPTIFVGRGAHRFLSREYILGVRLIASRHKRIKHVANLYSLGEDLAEEKLKQMDREQKDFFRKAFGKSEPSPSDFDLVINLDYFHDQQRVASVVENAFRQKFEI